LGRGEGSRALASGGRAVIAPTPPVGAGSLPLSPALLRSTRIRECGFECARVKDARS